MSGDIVDEHVVTAGRDSVMAQVKLLHGSGQGEHVAALLLGISQGMAMVDGHNMAAQCISKEELQEVVKSKGCTLQDFIARELTNRVFDAIHGARKAVFDDVKKNGRAMRAYWEKAYRVEQSEKEKEG